MPQILGEAMLFGRQTDRPARLEVLGLPADQAEALGALLAGLAGDAIEPQPERASRSAKMSASHDCCGPSGIRRGTCRREQLTELANQHVRRALLERWPARPLGILGGKSPREAAAEPAQKVGLLAAIMLLEAWHERFAR